MPKKTASAANLPITLDEAKAHCRVTFADDDDLITALIKAATHELETRTQRTFCETTYIEILDSFPSAGIRLSLPPLLSVQSIVYFSTTGAQLTLSANDYLVDTHNEPGWIYPSVDKAWPETQDRINAVSITYKAGYLLGGTAQEQRTAVPADIRAYLLIRVATLYENRESVNVGNLVTPITGLDSLWQPYRVIEA